MITGAPRPYRIDIAQADLDDLHDRLTRTRWPDELPGVGWDLGIPLGYTREVARYWRDDFDWRAQEARINAFPQFISTIDGADVHFLHVRSPEPDALPVIMTHGWPSSNLEFLDVIGPLTDPRAHGGDPAQALHLVIPSIPGYGFSGPTSDRGWDADRVARAWATLMADLGYDRYGAQGGDWGSTIARALGRLDSDHLVATHLNFLVPPLHDAELIASLDTEDQARVKRLRHYFQFEAGYLHIQSTRPQTLAYGLTDSPVGQLAWILEKFKEWTDSVDVPEDAIDRDRLLTNVMLYWLTATAGSSARMYYEVAQTRARSTSTPGTVPTGVAVFAKDVRSIRVLAETDENIVYWREFDRGGHFPALEQPELFVESVREFFAGWR